MARQAGPEGLLGGSGDESRIRDLFARSVKIVLTVCGTLVVLIILLAPAILKLWLGGDFPVRSALAFQLIAAGFPFLSFTYVAFNLLQGVGRTPVHQADEWQIVGQQVPVLPQ